MIQSVKAGAVFFAGSDLLSAIIAKVSGGNGRGVVPTHIALIDPRRALPGADLSQPVEIFESTIQDGKDGPQLNPLDQRVAQAGKRDRIWVCEFTDDLVGGLNWAAAVDFMLTKAGDRYNIPELPADLLHLPIGYSSHAEVCSELFLDTLLDANLASVIGWVPMPYGSSPEEIAPLPLFKSCTQIYGTPAALRGLSLQA